MTLNGVEEHRPEDIRAVPLRHPGRWVATAILLVLMAMLVHDILTNPGFGWGIVGSYFFAAPIVSGVEKTLELTFLAMAARSHPRRDLRRDAAVAQPHPLRRGLDLHLVLPGHTGVRATCSSGTPSRLFNRR